MVDRHGGRVFSDEIHAPLVYPGHRHVPYARSRRSTAGHTVTAISASKAWNLPGLKCAQLVLSATTPTGRPGRGPPDCREHGASTLGVVASTAAYEQGGPWLAEVLAYLDGNRRLLARPARRALPARLPAAEGTYLAWLDCRALGLGDHPAECFLEQAGRRADRRAALAAPPAAATPG